MPISTSEKTSDDVGSITVSSKYGDAKAVALRIKHRRMIVSVSKAAAAKHLGLSKDDYTKLEEQCPLKAQELYVEHLASLLKTSAEWLRRGDPDRLSLTPNMGDEIGCDIYGIPRGDNSPYTEKELEQLPFCEGYKAILRKGKGVSIPLNEYFWYGDEFFTINPKMTPEILKDVRLHTGSPGWEKLSVSEQCKLFNLPLTQVTSSEFSGKTFVKKPYGRSPKISIELFALGVYKEQGWEGFFDEGRLFSLVGEICMRALRLTDALWFKDQCTLRGLDPEEGLPMDDEGDEVIYPERLDDSHKAKIAQAFDSLTIERVSKLLRAIGMTCKIESDLAVIFNAVKLLDIDLIFKRIDSIFAGNYNGHGWPDLVLFRDGQIQFVEVKAKMDFMRKNQALWLRMVYPRLGIPLTVLHLVD